MKSLRCVQDPELKGKTPVKGILGVHCRSFMKSQSVCSTWSGSRPLERDVESWAFQGFIQGCRITLIGLRRGLLYMGDLWLMYCIGLGN